MFRAGEGLGVFFYREDLFPSAGEGEGYYVPTCSCEGVYEDCFGSGRCCYLLGDFAGKKISSMRRM